MTKARARARVRAMVRARARARVRVRVVVRTRARARVRVRVRARVRVWVRVRFSEPLLHCDHLRYGRVHDSVPCRTVLCVLGIPPHFPLRMRRVEFHIFALTALHLRSPHRRRPAARPIVLRIPLASVRVRVRVRARVRVSGQG